MLSANESSHDKILLEKNTFVITNYIIDRDYDLCKIF